MNTISDWFRHGVKPFGEAGQVIAQTQANISNPAVDVQLKIRIKEQRYCRPNTLQMASPSICARSASTTAPQDIFSGFTAEMWRQVSTRCAGEVNNAGTWRLKYGCSIEQAASEPRIRISPL